MLVPLRVSECAGMSAHVRACLSNTLAISCQYRVGISYKNNFHPINCVGTVDRKIDYIIACNQTINRVTAGQCLPELSRARLLA